MNKLTEKERCQYSLKANIRYQAGNQNGTTYALSNYSLTDSLHSVISRPEHLWLLSSYYLSFAHDEPFSFHHEYDWVLCLWKKKPTHTLASHLLCGYLPVSDGEAHHGQTKTCWAEQLWNILIFDRAALKESQSELSLIFVVLPWNNHIQCMLCKRAKFNLRCSTKKAISLAFSHLCGLAKRQEAGRGAALRGMPTKDWH